MSGHIAGPWFVHVDKDSGRRVRAIDPEDTDTPWNVAQVIDDCGYDGDTSEANARLIAAAPDLLEELEDLVEVFHGYQGMELTRAKAAIAKAKGQPRDDAGIRPASEEA